MTYNFTQKGVEKNLFKVLMAPFVVLCSDLAAFKIDFWGKILFVEMAVYHFIE